MRRLTFVLSVVLFANALAAEEPDGSLTHQVEQSIVEQTNEFREKHELKTLVVDEDLRAAAAKFAEFMVRTGKYGHEADGRTPAQRAVASGYEYCVVRENIAYRKNTGEVTKAGLLDAFVQGWIESPPHRENMLADYVRHTGVAVATSDQETYYAVQLFGRPKSDAIKVRITNESGEMQTLTIEANDSVDEIELPPRTVIKMTRCFPTRVKLGDEAEPILLKQNASLILTDEGLERED